MSSLKFTVKEDGVVFPVSHMSTHEADAIEECVEGLLPSPSSDRYWFEVDMTPGLPGEDDDSDSDAPYVEQPYGLVKCVSFNLKDPIGGVLSGKNTPHSLPEELIDAISGKSFVVYPRQFGVNPWGKKVEVIFESCVSEKPKGVKVSTLIAAALKA